MNLRDLFKSIPQPVRTRKGLYECRRCKARFEEDDMRPCRADSGTYRTINGDCYYRTATHQCKQHHEASLDREVYGVADLVGATVTTEYPETVE